MEDFTKMKKITILLIALMFMPLVHAATIANTIHLSIQATDENGNIQTGTFLYAFNITNSTDCSTNILYANTTTKTTDARGIINIYLPDVNLSYTEQYYICYYRDGVLKSTTSVSQTPYAYYAKDTDGNGTYDNSSPITLNGSTFGLMSCNDTQILKYNTTSAVWECSEDASGSGGSSYDQSLNTTDNVIFDTVNATTGMHSPYYSGLSTTVLLKGSDIVMQRNDASNTINRIQAGIGCDRGQTVNCSTGFYLINNASSYDGDQSDFGILVIDSINQTSMFISSRAGRNLILGDSVFRNQNYGHDVSDNPTLFIHSVTDPRIDNTQYLKLWHDKNNSHIDSGSGNIILDDAIVSTNQINTTGINISNDGSLRFYNSTNFIGSIGRSASWLWSSTSFGVTGAISATGGISAGNTLLTNGDLYTTGGGDDFWLGTYAQASALFRGYASGDLYVSNTANASKFCIGATCVTNWAELNGTSFDQNNYTTSIGLTESGSTKTIQLARNGLGNISTGFTDNTGGWTNTSNTITKSSGITSIQVGTASLSVTDPANLVVSGNLDNVVIQSNVSQIIQMPAAGILWHDLLAFGTGYQEWYQILNSSGGWENSTINMDIFAQKEDVSDYKIITNTANNGSRWIFAPDLDSPGWSGADWFQIAYTYSATTCDINVLFETSTDLENWSVKHNSTHHSTHHYSQTGPYFYHIGNYGGDQYMRVTVQKVTQNASDVEISSLKILTDRQGDQGRGSEYEYPYEWDAYKNIFFKTSINVTGKSNASQFCIGTTCVTNWDEINGSTTETDPVFSAVYAVINESISGRVPNATFEAHEHTQSTVTINAANVSAGTFGSGDFVFPNNVTIGTIRLENDDEGYWNNFNTSLGSSKFNIRNWTYGVSILCDGPSGDLCLFDTDPIIASDTRFRFGTASNAYISFSTAGADALTFRSIYPNHFMFLTRDNYPTPTGSFINPTVDIYANGTDVTRYLRLYHDNISGNIETGSGVLNLNASQIRVNGTFCVAGTCIDGWAEVNKTGGDGHTHDQALNTTSTVSFANMTTGNLTVTSRAIIGTRLGVGTTNPLWDVVLNGATPVFSIVGSSTQNIIMAPSVTNANGIMISSGTNGDFYIGSLSSASIIEDYPFFYDNDTRRVGIETNTPQATLDVAGDIKAAGDINNTGNVIYTTAIVGPNGGVINFTG